MRFRHRRQALTALGAVLLLTGLVAGPLTTERASANLSVCLDDPVLNLSNGTQLMISTSVATAPKNIQAIVYNLTLPSDVSIVKIRYPDSGTLKRVSTVVVSYTNPAGSNFYTTDAVVSSSNQGASVTLTEEVQNHASGLDWQATASGQVNQDLLITFQP